LSGDASASGSRGGRLHTARLHRLTALTRAVARETDTGRALRHIAAAGAEVRPGAICAISLFDREAGVDRLAAGQSLPDRGVVRHEVALEVAGERVGVLAMAFPADASFTTDDHALVDLLAAQATLAIRLARTGRVRNLARLNQVVSSSLDAREVLGTIAQAAAELMAAPLVSIWSADEATRTLERSAFSADGIQLDDTEWTMPFGKGGPGWVAVHRCLLEVPDVFRDDRIFARDWFRAHGFTSYFAVPILCNEALLGVLSVFGRQPFQLGEDDRDLLDSFVAQAGVAIRNARLYGETARRLDQTRALLEIAAILNSTLDSAELLKRVARKIAEACHVDRCRIERLDGDRVVPLMTQFVDGRSGPDLSSADGPAAVDAAPVYREVTATRRPVVIDDARIGPCMTVPLIRADQVAGFMTLDHGERPARFRDWQVDLAMTIAGQLALSLENARLFEERSRAYVELEAAQDQLVRTEKLRAMGEMASGVAHDFNNLLAAILGRTQLLLCNAKDATTREWLRVIERAAKDGARTVRRLQEFTRIRRDHAFIAVDLNEMIRDALEITQSRWQDEALRRGVNIEVRTSLGELPAIAGDPAELREALTNLILNAADAMPDGGVLEITTALGTEAVELTVRDTGVGIPESAREKIFDPFYTSKGSLGTGIGLSMTYGIVSRHGGRITVESEEGRGSTFRLTFPLSTGIEPGAAPTGEPASPVRPMRCLVIDDQDGPGTALADILRRDGHRVVVFRDGREAIARFHAEPFDVVFTDLAMPGFSGWEVARGVKAIAPRVPVCLVTGFGVELSSEESLTRGVDQVLTKPLSIDEIRAALARAAQMRPPTEGSPGSSLDDAD